jgi:hypothetical protein
MWQLYISGGPPVDLRPSKGRPVFFPLYGAIAADDSGIVAPHFLSHPLLWHHTVEKKPAAPLMTQSQLFWIVFGKIVQNNMHNKDPHMCNL